MPSRVLLINANRCTTPDPVFPLGLAQLEAALRQAGHECAWFDCLSDTIPVQERVKQWRPHFIGISLRNIDDVLICSQQTFVEDVVTLTQHLRRATTCPIILGGSGFSIFPRELLELLGADFGIAGEGETALPALIAALEKGTDYRDIPGLIFRKQGQILVNPPCPISATAEPGAHNWPAEITDHYLKTSGTLNVQTQRGCAFHCCYCTYPVIEGRRHRRRPAEAVASDFEQLQRLGAKYVFVVDSVFNSSPTHVNEICEALLKKNAKVPWGCFLRPQGLSRELVHLMARAGLAHIEFGSDSFSDEVLEAYHKDFRFEDIHHSSEMARAEKIDYCHYVIAGGPGETVPTLRRGFENSRRLTEGIILAVVGMRIYPGTKLFEQAIAENRIAPDVPLLRPTYYLAEGLSREGVFRQLQEFARLSPNWIVGDPEPSYTNLVARLRQRGVVGPLWSYFSMIQHIRPRELAGKIEPVP